MMRRAWLVICCLLFVRPAAAQRGPDTTFNHRQHAKLFPTCEGCHAGIATGDASTTMPTEAQCRECHNGTDGKVVTWRRLPRPIGLIRFAHTVHAGKVDSAGRSCGTCHATLGATWMDVRRAPPESCVQCHSHNTPHLADENRCATCHVPLIAATDLTADRIAVLPKPPSHERATFASKHAPASELSTATCAVCHARESCANCHVNAAAIPVINSLGRDARVARLVGGRVPSYAVPADHETPVFRQTHGEAARTNVLRCGSCHARPSCEACHTDAPDETLRRMPVAEPGGAKGVELIAQPMRRRLMPPLSVMQQGNAPDTTPRLAAPRMVRVHDIGFRTQHRTAAASNAMNCSSCHAQRFCTDCHGSEASRRFHPVNFTVRHAADGYRRDAECSSCHNAEAFCRDCHRQTGLASRGRLDVAFHTAQPQWLLQHGRAARQGLATCTTCHAQRDCLTCHSTTGWGVSPHGPGFDASRLAKSAPTTCLRCHVRVPGSVTPPP